MFHIIVSSLSCSPNTTNYSRFCDLKPYFLLLLICMLFLHTKNTIVALVLPLPDPTVPEQHEKCCILCKELPVWKSHVVHNLRCRLHHYYRPKAASSMSLLLNRNP